MRSGGCGRPANFLGLGRERGSIADFERQMDNIADAKSSIETLFRENRITVLDNFGRYMPEAVICKRMSGETDEMI